MLFLHRNLLPMTSFRFRPRNGGLKTAKGLGVVAEEKDINVVLTELFSSDGSETYVRPVEKFVDLSEEDTWSFWDVALKAGLQREVAVGYKPAELDYIEAEELIINPPDKAEKRKWSPGDKIITFSLED